MQSSDIMCFHLSSKMQMYHQPDPTIFPINSYPLFPPRNKYYPAFGTFLSSPVLLSPLLQIIPPTPKQWNLPLPIRSSVSDSDNTKGINDAINDMGPTSATLSVRGDQDVRDENIDVGQGIRAPANNSTARPEPEAKNATTDDNFSLQDFIIQDTHCSRSDCHNYSQFCLIYTIQSLIPWLQLL